MDTLSLLQSVIESCVGDKGVCASTNFVLVPLLGDVSKKRLVYRFHTWLAKQRDSCGLSSTTRDDKHASVPLSLPTHLPLAPSADVFPNVSPTDGSYDHSLATAWLWTEWIVAY